MLFLIGRILAKLKISPDYYKTFGIQRPSGEGLEIRTEYSGLHSEELKAAIEKIKKEGFKY